MEDFVIQYRIIVQLANMESCMIWNSFMSTIPDLLKYETRTHFSQMQTTCLLTGI